MERCARGSIPSVTSRPELSPHSTAERRAVALLVRVTALRIALVPVIMALVLHTDARVLATGLFVIAALTDFFDGYLARRWGVTTALGSFLDTTADKLLTAGTLIALAQVGRASAWVVAVIVGRELLIMGLRGVVASEGTVMAPSIWGKLKTNVQFTAIPLAILRPGPPLGGLYLDEWALLLAAVITVMSAVEYLRRFRPLLTSGRR